MKKIGKYEIIEQIGRGAMGVVYKAMDPFIERVVAVKTMSADLDADPDLRSRFFREARSAGQLSHKNIVTIYELGEESGQAYIAMEFLDGEDIKARILRGDRIPLEDRLGYMIQISEGLSHAHKKGVFHRDIKPGNIYVTSAGQVKILDFGLARIASSEMTKTGSVLGTPNYMSPEQIRGAQVDYRSDIFSAGATFYELLTFRKPFDGDSLQSTFFKILQEEPEPVERVVPAIPQEFSTVVLKAMAKEPAERYQNADEMLQALTRLEKVLEQHKRKTREEAGAAVEVLDSLIGQNAKSLSGEFKQSELDGFKTRILLPDSARRDQDDEAAAEQAGYLEIVAIREKAKQERERLEALLRTKQKTDLLLREAVEFEEKDQLEKALELVEKAVDELPKNAEALGAMARIQKVLADRAQTEARNAIDQLDQLISQNAELLEGEEFASPSDLKAAVLLTSIPARSTDQDATIRIGRDNSRDEVLKIRDRAAHEAERLTGVIAVRKRIALRLQDALDYERSGKLEDALGLANEILGEIPDHSQAHALVDRVRETLAQRARQQEERRRLDRLIRQSRQLYSQKKLAEALHSLDEALAIDPQNSDALALRRQTTADIEEERRQQERAAEVASLLEQTPVQLSAGDLPGARSSLAKVLKLEPNHSGAAKLLADVERQIQELAEREEKRRKFEARVAAAQKALDAGNPAEARREIESALAIDPQGSSAQELLARIARAEEAVRTEAERKSRIAEKLEQARKLANTGELDRARDLASSVLKEETGHPEAVQLLGHIEKLLAEKGRQQRIRELQERAEGLAQRKDYSGAASLLEKADPDIASENSVKEALKRYQDAARVQSQEAEGIAKALADAGKALGSGRLKEARELVAAVLAKDPARVEAAKLLKQIDEAAEKKKESEQAEEKCRALLTQAAELASLEKYQEAISLLKSAKPPAGLQQSVAQAIKQYQKAHQAQEEARGRRERMERGRNAFDGSDYATCVAEMDLILAQEPNNADALALRKQAAGALQKQHDEEQRQKELADVLRLAQQCIDKGDLKAARAHVSRAQTLSPENQTAAVLSALIEKNEAALREEQKKQQRGRELAGEAQAALKKDDPDRAGVLLAEAMTLGVDASLSSAIKKDIDTAQENRRQREEVEKEARALLAQVQEFTARNEHAAAVSALERAKPAVGALPSVKQSLEQQRKALKVQEEARELARRVKEHLERGKQLFKSQDYAGSTRELDQVLAQEPNHSEAVDLRRSAVEALDKQRKEERGRKELAEAFGAARQSLEKGDLKAARGHVSRAQVLDRENADVARVNAQIDKREAELRQEQERKQRRQDLVTSSDSALGENDPARAEALLAEAVALGLEPAAAASLQKRIDKLKKRAGAGSPAAATTPAATLPPRTGVPRPATWLGAAVAVIAVGYLIWTLALKGPQYQEQIAAARSHIELQEFDKVAGELQPIPATSPLYSEAQSLIQQASEGAKRKSIEVSLAAAVDLRKQGKNQESLAAAENVLKLDAANQAATSLRSEILRESFEDKTQADRKVFLASALASAEALLKSGDLQGAMVKTSDVLRLQPDDSDAGSLKRRIENQIAGSKNAAAEQAKLTQAKAAAQNANAPELASARFTAAQQAEDSALRDQKAGQFDRAVKGFATATALYGEADRAARTESQIRADREKEDQRNAAAQALRGLAETARNGYEQSRTRAQNADADSKVRDRFLEAVRQASTAQASFNGGDFAGARTGWEAASTQMQAVQADALKVTPTPPPQTAANVPPAAPPPAPVPPRASTPPSDDRNRQAAEAALAADRLAIRATVEKYRTAYMGRSINAIKAIFPGIAGTAEEKTHINNFNITESIQMQLIEKSIEISGETAKGVYQQQIEAKLKDKKSLNSPLVTITFNLQKRSGSWIITGVTR